MPTDPEKLNRLEELKTRLSSKNYEMRPRHKDNFTHPSGARVPDTWEEEEGNEPTLPEKFFMQTSAFKKFFTFSVIFFVVAAAFAAYTFFGRGNTISNQNIEIAILGNAFTAGGEELPLQVEITNKNSSALELADLLVEYPKGSAGDLSQNTERQRISLGTIPGGGVRTENVKIILFGEQGATRPVKVSLEYRVEGSNAIFVKGKDYEVTVSSTPISISLEAPSEISPNQDIALGIKAALNATRPAENMLIKVDYPVGFEFGKADPAPSIGNNVWKLGDLPPGSQRDIAISGKMVEVADGEEKTFRVWSGSGDESDKSKIGVVFNSLSHTVLVKKPFIEAKLYVNGVYQKEYATDSKTAIGGEIRWTNNLDTKVNDLVIKAKITGNAFDRKKVTSNDGFYNSAEDTITWDMNSKSEFAEVEPGDSGGVNFSLSPLPLLGGSDGVVADPSIRIDVSISGRQPVEGNAPQELENSESKIIRITSDIGFAAKALYYSGAFKNTGPIPPKAEQKTTYTVVWSVSNTSNNISKAEVKATLPPWTSFTGKISPPSEDLSYNPSTKEIRWNIGNIGKGAGVNGGSREVSFQLELLPSVSQVGSAPVLINDAVLTGHDDFANVVVRVNKSSLDTRLGQDPMFPVTGSRVVE